MKETFNFLNKLLNKDDVIVLGISGGPDSMCLLHVINSLKERFNLTIICAHVNHGLRIESKKEAIFVKEYCENNNIIFEYLIIDNYLNNKFSEEEARRKRYQFFDDLVNKYHANYLMTAHHGDDLIETILMRLVRGSNLNGYIGIPLISENDNYKIIRPLLNVTKEDIYSYLKVNSISYVVDYTNESDKYTRNRFRKHMLPFLKIEDKNVHLKFLKYSRELEKYNKYINNIIQSKINNIYRNNKINIEELLKEDDFIQEKIIEYVIRDIQKNQIFNISDNSFHNILELLRNEENSQIDLANNFIARRSYNYLIIEKDKNVDNYKYELNDKLIINNKYVFEKIKTSNLKNNNIIRLDSKELVLPLCVRNKKEGDKIKAKNMNGTKKLKDIFIDSKIDIKKRSEYPVVVDAEDTIIWLPGIKKSIFDKEINQKYDIIIKYTEENNE